VAALVPVAAVATSAQTAPTPAPVVHRTRAAKKPAATPAPKSTPPVQRITRTITRTVNDVVEVIPTWAKVAIAALAGLLLAAAVFMFLGALRQRRLRRERAALLEDVGVLQEALLPTVPATVGSLAVSVAYRPAAGLAAGGDFYDVFPLERGSTGIILGDVSGHGREALGPATFVRHMVRSYLEAGLTPRASLQLAGNVLDEQNRDEFATIVAGVYDPSAGTLSYAAAGHPPPIVTGPAAFTPLRVASSPPAGTGETTGLRQTTVALPPGSTVCFFTDGLAEARVGKGVFGRERLQFAVEELAPDATADDLVDLIAHATQQQLRDDVAVCLIRTVSGAPAGTVRVEELEVTMSDLQTERLKRFFDACGVRPGDVAAARLAAARQVGGFGSVLLRVRMAERRSGVDVVPVARATSGGTVIPVGSIR
jgi:serine phosphatase RsbU (regulator of sigma subunit)